jgi:hypothetical protein
MTLSYTILPIDKGRKKMKKVLLKFSKRTEIDTKNDLKN